MRPLLLTLGTRVVTTVPRLALQAAGLAWQVGEDVVERVLRTAPPTAARLVGASPAAAPPVVPPAEAPKGEPTPRRADAASERIEAPTSPAPEVTVSEPAPDHADLPLPDYDHLTVGSLRTRIRSLDLGALRQLHAYEVAHGDRLPVLAVLSNRIAQLEKDQPATSTT